MAHELAFADAIRPMPVRVLRLPLRAYSLGHELLLLRYRNALRCLEPQDFAALGFNTQVDALKKAAFICARTMAQTQRKSRFLRLWEWSIRGDNLVAGIEQFQTYLAAGLAQPKFAPLDLECPGRAPGAPELVNLYQWLATHRDWLCLAEFRPPIADLWDYPLALARLEYYSALEAEGKCRLQNAQEAANDFDAWVAEQEARVASGEIKLPNSEVTP